MLGITLAMYTSGSLRAEQGLVRLQDLPHEGLADHDLG